MNAAQRDRAIAVIRATTFLCSDGLLKNDAVHASAGRTFVCCAIGELALAAGHSEKEVRETDGSDVADYPYALPKLREVFGLTPRDCEAIVDANDEPEDVVGLDVDDFIVSVTEDYVPVYDLRRLRKAAVVATIECVAGGAA